MLYDFIAAKRTAIIARTRAKVGLRAAPLATEEELTRGIPLFLDQLIGALRLALPLSDEMADSATRHGRDLLERGFTIAQVVHDYGAVCQAVTELAGDANASISVEEFQLFNRCLDDVIAQAVTEYSRSRERAIAEIGMERLGNVSHELRNVLGTALLAFRTLKVGSVGLGGSTAAVLDRSLRRACQIIDSSVAEIRLELGKPITERLSMSDFIEEVEVGASMEAHARGLTFVVTPVPQNLEVEADRHLLAAAAVNLLQNAFKFTHPRSQVTLSTSASEHRVLISVMDECGGLPPGQAEELFRPFQQKGNNRTGLGLGLSISRKSVEAVGGELRVTSMAGQGCIFTIDLPRIPSALV